MKCLSNFIKKENMMLRIFCNLQVRIYKTRLKQQIQTSLQTKLLLQDFCLKHNRNAFFRFLYNKYNFTHTHTHSPLYRASVALVSRQTACLFLWIKVLYLSKALYKMQWLICRQQKMYHFLIHPQSTDKHLKAGGLRLILMICF